MKTAKWIIRLLPWAVQLWQLLNGTHNESPGDVAKSAENEPKGSTLVGLSSDILSGLAMLRVGFYGNQPLSDMRDKLLSSLDDFSQRGIAQGWPKAVIDTARYALVAYIDEAVLASNRQDKKDWMAWPLQLELFAEQTAGEKFFACLDELRRDPQRNIDLLELFYVCLRLGFKGAYSLRADDQLKILEKELLNEIELIRGAPKENLSVTSSQTAASSYAIISLPYWVIVAFTVTSLTLSYFFFQGYAEKNVTQVADIDINRSKAISRIYLDVA
ncbi:outer membrane protein ImpK/VasF [Halorhodospira halochloris]|uniref:Outer membrane protein ImpK/VasF n=1 Tax=Halorhodospira halochloris TaxID=1052 RepID=A0A0X8XBK8_HALHR|nr:type IVB secretion system protein IcmH/DotU [Halorhodospira halochloris]MBK1651714.1 hypothetical protein [Halorhodospira halochloris]MCG5548561.1 type IVB secretion system protein IcmH/DotU [Halorhodospira halochloris]BAU58577.1 outer membrane protein ImpK/VasF [Halorhodospira halochloris]